MNLNDYFDPVSLEKPEFSHLRAEETFSRYIDIHTPDTPIKNIEEYQLAIFGVKEDRNAFISGSASAPDKVREKLYLLSSGPDRLKIIDLGNLKITENVNDSYFALRDVFTELRRNSVTAIIIGGSQDLGIALAKSYEEDEGFKNFTSIDPRIDFNGETKNFNSANYLSEFLKLKNHSMLSISNIGHQQYFVSLKQFDSYENKGHSSLRLGIVRTNMKIAEPILRDSDILSIDINAVQQSDAPAGSNPSPNGFSGQELCRLTRYAGTAEKTKAVLISEIIPASDLNNQTTHLAAQSLWYFIEGYSIRRDEDPVSGNTKKFIVSTSAAEQNMIFYKSNDTDRWWMEVPVKNPLTGVNYIIACGYEDYQQACTNEIPDRWWKLMRRFS